MKKLKTIISEMEANFKRILTEKDLEFLNDIKSLEKKYNEIFEDQNNKIFESKKETERIIKALKENQDFLKNSLLNEDKNEKALKFLEKELEIAKDEKDKSNKSNGESIEDYKKKIKLFDLEVRDQNEIILKNENLLKSFKKSMSGKDDENNVIYEESAKLKNNITQMHINVEYFINIG